MKKLGLLMLAVLMISLSSCGGDDANKAKDTANEAVENTQKAADQATETKEDAAKATEDAAQKAEDQVQETATADVDGKSLFTNNGCIACHQVDKKTVGPGLKEIATAYAGKKDDMVKFLKGEGKAIVDPAQFATMKPNLEITKKMNDAQVGAIADYILSVK